MATNYPGALDSYSTDTDGTTFILASESNNQSAAILALERNGLSVVNVKTFRAAGAKGDGATNDSTAIQAALDACLAAGGGIVYFPPGTYLASGLNLYGKVRLMGAANEAVILKLPNGANTFLLQTYQFASLAAGGGGAGAGTSSAGEAVFSIEDITFDGNKTNNASANVPVVRLYGYGYRLKNVTVRSGDDVGLYSEWSTFLPAPGFDSMMAQWVNVKAHDCGGHGVHMNGPHDSMWVNGEVYNNGARGVFVDAKGSGFAQSMVHSWGLTQTYAMYLGATGCRCTDCVAEGAITAQLAMDGDDCSFNGFIYGAGAAVPVGIELGTGGTRQDMMVVAKINNCTSGAIKVVNDGGALIVADVFQSSGTLISGTLNGLTRLDLRTNGIAGGRARFPVDVEIGQGKGLKLYNAAESSFVTVDFDGSRINSTWPFRTASGQYLLAGGSLRRTVQAPAHSATPTPNVALGNIFAPAAMTANVTVGAPTNGAAGDELIFIWLQDGTGTRTVTYNAVYKTTGTGAVTAITTAASTRTIDKFITDDGTNWRLTSRITGQ